jgi:hypothetical protein
MRRRKMPSSEDAILNRRKIAIDGDELFFYVGLNSAVTGLPMIVWAPDSLAKDPHLRVHVGHLRRSSPNDVCLVSINENPRRLGGKELSDADFDLVRRFVRQNREALLAHRAGDISSGELVRRLLSQIE